VNRILRISTDRWVTGRAIRWACESARLARRPNGPLEYTRYGTDIYTSQEGNGLQADYSPAIAITVERDNGN
jgi:hypothetical protein